MRSYFRKVTCILVEKISVTYEALKTRRKIALNSYSALDTFKDRLPPIYYFISSVLCLGVKSRDYIVWFLGIRDIFQPLKVPLLVF